MCSIDWGLFANVVGALAAVATLVVAVIALRAWKWPAQSAVVQEVEAAARELRYAYYDARAPLVEGWEFPEDYWAKRAHGQQLTADDDANAWWYVYQNRLKEVWPHMQAVARLRAKAGAAAGDDVAAACEELLLGARRLRFHMEDDARRRADPEQMPARNRRRAEDRWPDLLIPVRGATRNDAISVEFERPFAALVELLRRHR